MTAIKNIQPLSATALFDVLKTEFPDYVNTALDANLSIEFAHVADIINIMFPEIIEGIVFSLTVSEDVIEEVNYAAEGDYNTALLEEHLIAFLNQKAG